MLMLRDGLTYLLIGGLVWIDHTTCVTLAEWLSARDPLTLTWRHGNCPA